MVESVVGRFKPSGLYLRNEIIEDPLATGLRIDSLGNAVVKELYEDAWDQWTPEDAIAEAQRAGNFCDYTFATGWGGNGTNSTIDFFGHTIPCRVMGNTGNWMCSQTSKLIPSMDVAYVFSIWMYCTQKTAGNQYLGLYVYNSAGSRVSVVTGSGTTLNSNPYFHSFSWADSRVPKNKWVNYRGILVPNQYASGIAENFIGNIVRNTADMMIVECPTWYRFNTDNVKMLIRFLDYYNNTQQSYSWWALPAVVPVKLGEVKNGVAKFKRLFEGVVV